MYIVIRFSIHHHKIQIHYVLYYTTVYNIRYNIFNIRPTYYTPALNTLKNMGFVNIFVYFK